MIWILWVFQVQHIVIGIFGVLTDLGEPTSMGMKMQLSGGLLFLEEGDSRCALDDEI